MSLQGRTHAEGPESSSSCGAAWRVSCLASAVRNSAAHHSLQVLRLELELNFGGDLVCAQEAARGFKISAGYPLSPRFPDTYFDEPVVVACRYSSQTASALKFIARSVELGVSQGRPQQSKARLFALVLSGEVGRRSRVGKSRGLLPASSGSELRKGHKSRTASSERLRPSASD